MNRIGDISLLRRALWAVMLLGHVPAVWRRAAGVALSDDVAAHLPGLLALVLASALFLLKTVDVRWLRLRTDLRSCCTLAVLFGLVHTDVLVRSTGDVPPPAVVVSSSLGVVGVAGLLGAARCRLERRACVPADAAGVYRRPAVAAAVPPPLERLHSPTGLRAPPSSLRG